MWLCEKFVYVSNEIFVNDKNLGFIWVFKLFWKLMNYFELMIVKSLVFKLCDLIIWFKIYCVWFRILILLVLFLVRINFLVLFKLYCCCRFRKIEWKIVCFLKLKLFFDELLIKWKGFFGFVFNFSYKLLL